jgi:RNA-directed DNA polymerase
MAMRKAGEPAHEAWFHERSGVTSTRCKFLCNQLRSTSNGKDKKVIELNIEKCFDINHQTTSQLRHNGSKTV